MKKHTKRYMLIFKTISGKINTNPYIKDKVYLEKINETEEEFDTIQAVKNIIAEYTELYKDEIAPVFINGTYINKYNGEMKSKLDICGWDSAKGDNENDWKYQKEFWDFSDNKKWWAYIVLDFDVQKIILTGGNVQEVFVNNRKHNYYWLDRNYKKINLKTDLSWRDKYFHGDDEIPENYKWDDGEYEGWLQYRWGDGKNSLTYIEPPKKKKIEVKTEEASEEDLKKYLSNYDEMIPNDTNDDTINDTNDDTISDTNKYNIEAEEIENALVKEDDRDFKNSLWRY